Y
ncbi:unnamed protein product, partial [Linum tenue]